MAADLKLFEIFAGPEGDMVAYCWAVDAEQAVDLFERSLRDQYSDPDFDLRAESQGDPVVQEIPVCEEPCFLGYHILA